MRRDIKDINKKLNQAAGEVNPSDKQMKELANLANKYKNKSESEIEKEMNKLADSFSASEKSDMLQKLKMLKNMSGLLDNNQRKKVDMFIKLLSK